MEPQNNTQDQQTSQNVTAPNGSNAQFPSVFGLYPQSWAALKIAFSTLIRLAIRPLLAALPLLFVVMLQTMIRANGEPIQVINIASITIGIISVIAVFVWAVRIAPASTYVQLEAVRNRKVDTQEALDATRGMAADYFILGFLTSLVIILGFIFLIIPGLVMMKRYILAPYYFVDEKLGVGDAMSRSSENAKIYSNGHWGLVGLQAVMFLISNVPFVGSIISFVMSIVYYMVPAIRYEQVKQIVARA